MNVLRMAPVAMVVGALVAGCSGGSSTGSSSSPSTSVTVTAAGSAATAAYKAYVIKEVKLLTTASRKFTDAVRAGNLTKAKALFAPARYHYETIEPVAESFGALDPDIDARINDVASASQWRGFHRIEQILWVGKTTKGATGYANQLDKDIARLKTLVAKETYQPAQLANGATSLLDEVAKSKVTGEEDRYSHTDTSDFAANVAGSYEAFTLVKPLLAAKSPALVATIDADFKQVQKSLAEHQKGTSYASYTTVDAGMRKSLAQQVDALAEPLSQVAALVV
jgi:iron uptake system component EfeO